MLDSLDVVCGIRFESYFVLARQRSREHVDGTKENACVFYFCA
jgi:hypothetical protein